MSLDEIQTWDSWLKGLTSSPLTPGHSQSVSRVPFINDRLRRIINSQRPTCNPLDAQLTNNYDQKPPNSCVFVHMIVSAQRKLSRDMSRQSSRKSWKKKRRIFQPKFRNSPLEIRTNAPCAVCALTSANSKGPDDYQILITQPSNIERVIRMGKDISNPRALVQSLVKIHHILCCEHSLDCWWIRKNWETESFHCLSSSSPAEWVRLKEVWNSQLPTCGHTLLWLFFFDLFFTLFQSVEIWSIE